MMNQAEQSSGHEPESDVNYELLSSLKDMGVEEEVAKTALINTNNGGIEAAFVYIEEHPEITATKVETPAENSSINTIHRTKKRPRLIPLELQRLFSQLKMAEQESISTKGQYFKSFVLCLYLSIYPSVYLSLIF